MGVFSAGVLAAAKVTPQARGRTGGAGDRAARLTGSLAAAAVVIVWLMRGLQARAFGPPVSGEREVPVPGRLRRAAGRAAAATVGRDSARSRRTAAAGSTGIDTESDGLTVRVTNLSGTEAHLMAFAWDAAGDVHWLYPAYLDRG